MRFRTFVKTLTCVTLCFLFFFASNASPISPLIKRQVKTLRKASAPEGQGQNCLGLIDQNLAKGPDNFYLYLRFSSQRVTIQKGDVLTYEVFLGPNNPEPKGGIDVNFNGTAALRDHHIPDQNGIDSHGDGFLGPAVDHWFRREIPLTSLAGHATTYWTLVFEGDRSGTYCQFIDRIQILHAHGNPTDIYPSPDLESPRIDSINGYGRHFEFSEVPRTDVRNGAPVQAAISAVQRNSHRMEQIRQLADAVTLAQSLPDLTTDQRISTKNLAMELSQLRSATALTDEEFRMKYQKVLDHSQFLGPLVKSLKADLIGHAHIDVQWLWQSPESLQAAHNTWKQATIFMNQYPGFTFSQSSAGYYREVQQTWPDLFETIQKYVKTGQWELLGGRECEADENLISPEASASQFLYAQRYFRKEFGKTAVVGWEPDTFGHTAQMPQILQLGGCKYFYFCRGGKGQPLFNWEAMDGSKVLAYDEVAAGAWYDSPLDQDTPFEFPNYVKKTGQKEMMWVYGVGNHGGGPTKEYIDQAEHWMKQSLAPTVKFSTAQRFFQTMAEEKASSIPTLKTELQGVFEGCYTTNSFEKKRNDYAEADTVQAESVSAVAHALGGYPYPTPRLAQNWEKILFNQHHDTLCGSSFHWAYDQTIPDLDSVIADDKSITRDAMVNLSVQVTPAKGGPNFLVFNSLGRARSGWVNVYLPTGFGGPYPSVSKPIAVSPNGDEIPIFITDPITRAATFYAKEIPSYGYRVYVVKREGHPMTTPHNLITNGGTTVKNGILTATFDLEHGCIQSLVMNDHEYAGPRGLGGLINTLEKPEPSAWNINPIVGTQPVNPISHQFVHSYRGDGIEFTYEIPPTRPTMKPTRMWQTFWLLPGADHVEVDFRADWQAISTLDLPSPFLRAMFDSPSQAPVASYQVPFGVVTRPTDGSEGPVQGWADVSAKSGGVSVVVDCKHGFSCDGSLLRMSLIRGCYAPDPLPNPGMQSARYEIIPHAGSWANANLSQAAQEIQSDLLSIPVPPDAEGTAPLAYSFAHYSNGQLVPTGLKMSEDGSGYVFRFFDGAGKGTSAKLDLTPSLTGAEWVNFIEDHLHGADSNQNTVGIQLRPWQIGNIEVKVAQP